MATINGTNGDDLDLKGTKSADIIDGLLGADIMTGLGGNDVYIVENAGDTVKEIAGGGIDTVKSSVSFTLDAEIENLTLTGSASFGGGNTLNNIIIGNDAANVINGGAGKDTMSGGMGSDIYFVDDVGDKVVENSDPVAGGVDLIISTVTYSIAALSYVEKLSLGGTDNINATGNIHNNTLAGNDANNVLSGGGGSDVMQGQGGDDTLNGGTGSDQMEGGAGNDTFYIDTLLDLAIEVAGEGTDTVISTFAFANSVANVENYVFNTKTDVHFTGDAGDNDINGGAGNDVIVGNGGQDYLQGNAGNDTLTGGSGNDWFAGGTGADTMTGGKGNDAYYVDNIGDKVIETGDAGSGYDKIYSTISIDHLTDNIENGVLLGKAALHLTGNDLGNGLGGNWGANIIDGGKGADYLYGGLGNDTYIVDNAGDIVEEKTSGKQGGVDLVKSSVDFTLGAHVENLTLTDNGNNHGTGNDLNNVITGNDGDNVLDGGSGNDTLIGGKGGDTYFVESIGDKVVESITNAKGGGEDWVFSTIDYSLASLANVDVLYLQGTAIKATGNALDNGLWGNTSDNVLDGGKGVDAMHGDYGNDTYYVDNAGDQVLESAGVDTGNDTIVSTIAFNTMVANVENYTFNTAAAVFFTGDAGDNVIKGGSGADTIDGAGGHDTLSGGAGNDQLFGGSLYDLLDGGKGADNMVGGGGDDVYSVDNIGDKVVETGAMNSGTDTVFSTISVDLLWDNVESLQLQGTGALHATGNNLDNSIGGNDGNNVINGGAGIDFLVGHKGNDTLTGGSGSDTFHFDIGAAGNEGHDTITDFVSAADVLSFTVGDVNNDKVVDINDLLVGMSVVDHGIGKAVDVHFADGGEITFAGVGTNTITHIEQLVADATTQIHVN